MAAAIHTRRPMFFGRSTEPVDTPVYDGTKLGAESVVHGPAVIDEPTTTIVVQPGWSARLDATACYVITSQD